MFVLNCTDKVQLLSKLLFNVFNDYAFMYHTKNCFKDILAQKY